MIYNIFPTKDATIYDYSASMNTGRDPLLELEKITSSSVFTGTHKSRALLYFDWETAETKLNLAPGNYSSKASSNNASWDLKLYTAEATAIPYSYKLEVKTMLEHWEMGIGKRDHNPITEKGVSWKYRDNSGSIAHTTPGAKVESLTNTQTQSFEFESTDILINISESIAKWRSSSAANHGVCVSYTSSQEADALSYGSQKFFSMDTNTIYSPRIQVGWDDSSFSTGSLSAASSDEILVYIKNGKYEYQEEETVRFEVRARDTTPIQTYATTSAALETFYLPTGSYWSIEDAETEEKIIDFDSNYTKLSCTSSGNYFVFPMNSLTSERLYKIVIKTENRNWDGQIEKFDVNQLFKVVR